jgi:hypothetical protein
MTATSQDIEEWFDTGVSKKATHMIVVCDTFDHEDYPVYVESGQDVRKRFKHYDSKSMQRVMEVYHLGSDKTKQLAEHRSFNFEPLS